MVLRPGGGSWGKSPKIATPVPNVTTNRFSSIADAPENRLVES